MAEEVIIKVDGLQDLKQIEASFQAFTTSINAAINALAASGNKSFVGAVKQISVETANLNKITSQNTTETKANEEATKRATRAKQEFTRATGAASKGAVGMYGATYQLSQVMRELPNFAIDARIGFLSLSNNLPMMADSFMMLSKSIDVNTGKMYGMRGALKAFGASLLSFNTIMILATTLLVLYGEKIIDWITNVSTADKVQQDYIKTIADTNSAINQGIGQYENINELVRLAKDGYLDKDKVLSKYNETYAETLGYATDINQAEQFLIDNKGNYVDAVLLMAKAQSAYNLALAKSAQALSLSESKPGWFQRSITAPFKFFMGLSDKVSIEDQIKDDVKALEDETKKLFEDSYKLKEELASKYPTMAEMLLGISTKGSKSGKSAKAKGAKQVQFDEDTADAYFEGLAKWYDKWTKSLEKEDSGMGALLAKDVEAANKANLDLLESDKIIRDANKQAQMETLREIGTITDSISGLYDARIDKINATYDLEEARIEGSLMSEQAKNQALKALDEKRYKEELALFEERKKWQIATVWIDAAAGIMNAWTEKTLAVSPFDLILRVAKTTAILSQAATQTANINAQKPNAPKAIGGGGSGLGAISATTALSPQKTALTSSEENLNMMNATNFTKQTNVVKVSEINKVQNNVKVRETNQSY